MLYQELKKWFRANYNDLPGTLKTEFKHYHNVKHFVSLNISQIDNEIARLKGKIKYSKLATSSKSNLIELYEELKKYS